MHCSKPSTNYATITVLILAMVVANVQSHMMMSTPPPRSSVGNPGAGGFIDYSYTSPLTPALYPCKKYAAQTPIATYAAGSSASISITGGATHNGGHCQWSLSYDDTNFVAVSTVIRTCLQTGVAPFQFTVPIPASAPAGNATLAWSWVNASGNREYYMNCADIVITNPSTTAKSLVGPQMLVGNLAGISNITFLEFGVSGVDDGRAYYTQQPTITISPTGSVTTPVGTTSTANSAVYKMAATTDSAATVTPSVIAGTTTSSAAYQTTTSVASSVGASTKTSASSSKTTKATTKESVAKTTTTTSVSAVPTVSGPGICTTGDMECVGTTMFGQCANNYWYIQDVPPGTVCASKGVQSITLAFASD